MLVKCVVSALPLEVAVLEGHPQLSTEFHRVKLGSHLVRFLESRYDSKNKHCVSLTTQVRSFAGFSF